MAAATYFVLAKRTEHVRPLQESYSVERHLKSASENAKQIFLELKERIMGLDDSILEEPKKKYIAYKLTTNFVDVTIQKSALKIFLNLLSGKLNDPYNFARDLEKPKHVGHWGNAITRLLSRIVKTSKIRLSSSNSPITITSRTPFRSREN